MSAPPPALHAGELVAEALRAERVTRVYTVPGSHIHPIYDGLSRVSSIRMITCKQEPNVSLMADAHGRLTREPGVCIVTAGPGGVNSMAGIAQAYGAASPVVHIGGAVPLNADMEAFHGVDNPAAVHEMFQRITKWSVRIERIEDIPHTMARAFHIARSGRPGPVHVEVPRLSDYSEHLLQEERVRLPAYQAIPQATIRPDHHNVDDCARRVMAAGSPVIAAGKGVIRQNAMAELSALALKLQASVVCAQDAIGVIAEDHPFFAGHFSSYRSHPLCLEALRKSDLVLGVGLRAGAAEMSDLKRNSQSCPLILVGYDDAADRRYERDGWSVADPKLFLAALLERVAERPHDEALSAAMAQRKSALRGSLAEQNRSHRHDAPVHPGVLMDVLRSMLGKDAIVASDVGNCQMWARTLLPIATPESFMQSGVWNAMSYALPTAIVAKLEFPQRQVVALAGDGAFLMTLGDLPTAVEHGAHILMIVLNDGAFGQTYMQQAAIYGHTYGTEFKSPDFKQIAEGCGAVGMRVADGRSLEAGLRAALAATHRSPVLLEVLVSRAPYPKI